MTKKNIIKLGPTKINFENIEFAMEFDEIMRVQGDNEQDLLFKQIQIRIHDGTSTQDD